MAERFVLTARLRLQAPRNVTQVVNSVRQQLQGLNANINIQVPASQQRQLKRVQTSVKKVTQSTKQATHAMTTFGEQAALAAKRYGAFLLSTTAFLKLLSSIQSGLGEAVAFERELVKIAQVTGSTMNSLGGLTDEITRLSTTFGAASNELLQASRILAQTGLSAKDTTIALEALAKSDLAPTFESINKTSEASVAIMRQFNIEATQLESKLGAINAVSGQFAVESGDITAAVRRTGGAFAAAGGTLEELIALFTSVRATTRESAESIATGFRTIFTRLQRVRTQNFLETLGIDLRDLNNQFVGPLEAIRRLSTALQELPGTDPRFAQIIEELGGFRQVSKVIPLIQQFATAEKALGVAALGTASLTDDAAKAQASLAVQISKTREEFVALLRKVANNSAFKSLVNITLKLANAFIKVAETVEPLLPFLTAIAAVGVGRVARPFLKGALGTGALGFARGGLVPGKGHGDTVPAMLEPGEFVIRKKAVETIGVHNLDRANYGGRVRFQEGGQVAAQAPTVFGATFADPSTPVAGYRNATVTGDQLKEATGNEYTGPKVKVKVADATISAEHEKILRDLTIGTVQNLLDEIATAWVPNKPLSNKKFIPGQEAILGHIFEGAILRLGAPFRDSNIEEERGFDFPFGIGDIATSVFNRPELSNIPTEAKLKYTDDNRKRIKDKIVKYVAERPEAYGLQIKSEQEKVQEKSQAQGLSQVLGKPDLTINPDKKAKIVSKQSKQPVTKWEIADMLGIQGEYPANVLAKAIARGEAEGLEEFIVAAPKAEAKDAQGKIIKRDIIVGGEKYGTTSGRKPLFYRRAMGGFAEGGGVPALLTPGEYVLNKESADKLGPSQLFKLNNADRFAQGGYVDRFATGSQVKRKHSFGFIPYKMGDIRRRRRRTLDEEGELTPQAKEYASRRNKRFALRFLDNKLNTGGRVEELRKLIEEVPDRLNPRAMVAHMRTAGDIPSLRHIDKVLDYEPNRSRLEELFPETPTLAGAGYEAIVFKRKKDVVRISGTMPERPPLKEVLQPTRSGSLPTAEGINVPVEILPFAEDLAKQRERGEISPKRVDKIIKGLKDRTFAMGLYGGDITSDNVGLLQGKATIIDPGAIEEGVFNFTESEKRQGQELASSSINTGKLRQDTGIDEKVKAYALRLRAGVEDVKFPTSMQSITGSLFMANGGFIRSHYPGKDTITQKILKEYEEAEKLNKKLVTERKGLIKQILDAVSNSNVQTFSGGGRAIEDFYEDAAKSGRTNPSAMLAQRLMLDDDLYEQILEQLPPGSKYLSSGAFAGAFQLPDGNVLRLQKGNVERPRAGKFLQPISKSKAQDITVEKLPFALPIADDPSLKSQDRIDIHDDLINYSIGIGSQPEDLHGGNIGRIGQESKIIDPGSLIEFAKTGPVKATPSKAIEIARKEKEKELEKQILDEIDELTLETGLDTTWVLGDLSSFRSTKEIEDLKNKMLARRYQLGFGDFRFPTDLEGVASSRRFAQGGLVSARRFSEGGEPKLTNEQLQALKARILEHSAFQKLPKDRTPEESKFAKLANKVQAITPSTLTGQSLLDIRELYKSYPELFSSTETKKTQGAAVAKKEQAIKTIDFSGMSVQQLRNLRSDLEQFLMFQVELDPTGEITKRKPTKRKDLGSRIFKGEPYFDIGGSVNLPLLKLKPKRSRRVVLAEDPRRLQGHDFARPAKYSGITGTPGSKERIDQLTSFMETVGEKYEISPFDIPKVKDPNATKANLEAIREELQKRGSQVPVQKFANGGYADLFEILGGEEAHAVFKQQERQREQTLRTTGAKRNIRNIRKVQQYLDNLGLSKIRISRLTTQISGVGASYSPSAANIGADNSRTLMHEIGHSIEGFLPSKERQPLLSDVSKVGFATFNPKIQARYEESGGDPTSEGFAELFRLYTDHKAGKKVDKKLYSSFKHLEEKILPRVYQLIDEGRDVNSLRDDSDVDFLRRRLRLVEPIQYFAKGGVVDSIPAMLTPGEYVLNKKAVQDIGVNTLDRMNSGGRVQKFAHGGIVHMQGGGGIGGIQSGLIGLAIIPQVINQFEGLNKVLGPLLGIVSSFGAQLLVLKGFINAAGTQISRFNKNIVDVSAATRNIEIAKQNAQSTRDEFVALREKRRSGATLDKPEQRRLDILSASRQQQADTIKTNRNAIKTTNKFANTLSYAAGTTAFLAAGLSVAGDALTKWGEKLIASGKDIEGTSKVVVGSALTGASTGGTAGAALGAAAGTLIPIPGLSTAIGAAVGGVIASIGGGAFGAFRGGLEAERQKSTRDFGKAVDKLSRSFEKFNKQQITFSRQRSQLTGFVDETQERLLTVSAEEAAASLDLLKKNLGGFQDFFTATARKVASEFDGATDSVQDFGRFLTIAGSDTVTLFSSVSNIPFRELRQSIERQIESYRKGARAAETRLDVSMREQDIVNLTRAMGEAALATKSFASQVDRFVAFAEGTAFATPFSGAPELTNRTELFDAERFEKTIAREIGSNPIFNIGERSVGADIASEAISANRVIRELPRVLSQIRETRGTFDGEGIVDDIVDAFEKAPSYIRQSIRDATNKIIGSEGKEQKLLDQINTDLLGTAKQISAGFDPLLNTIADLSKRMTEETQNQIKALAQYTALEQKRVQQASKGLDLEEDRIRSIAKFRNRPVDIEELRGVEERRRTQVGADTAPFLLNLKLISAQNRLIALQNKLSDSNLSNRLDLVKSIEEENANVVELTNALKFLTDTSKRSAVIQEQLNRVQKANEIRSNVGEQFTFAETVDDVANLGRTIAATSRLIESGFDISTILPELRGDVRDFLKQFETADPFLGGLTGKEAIGKTIANAIEKSSARAGVPISRERAEEIGRLKATAPEEKLLKGFENVYAKAETANQYLINNISRQQDRLIDALQTSFENFVSKLQSVLLQQEVEKIKTDQVREASRQKSAKSAIDNIEKIQKDLGLVDTDSVFAIRNQYDEIKKVGKNFYSQTSQASRELISNIEDGSGTLLESFNAQFPQTVQPYGTPGGVSVVEISRTDFEEEISKLLDLAGSAVDVGDAGAVAKTNVRGELARQLRTATEGLFSDRLGRTTDVVSASKARRALISALDGLATELKTQVSTEEDLREIARSIGSGFDVEDIKLIVSQEKDFDELFRSFEVGDNLFKLGKKANEASVALANLESRLNKIKLKESSVTPEQQSPKFDLFGTISNLFKSFKPFAKGGMVSGVGSGDTIPAMLSPGEFVLNRNAVNKVGLEQLYAMNGGKVPKFQMGGLFKFGQGLFRSLKDILKKEQREKEKLEKNIKENFVTNSSLSLFGGPIGSILAAGNTELVKNLAGNILEKADVNKVIETVDKADKIGEARKTAENLYGKAYADKLTPQQLEKQYKRKQRRLKGRNLKQEREERTEKLYGGKEALDKRRAENLSRAAKRSFSDLSPDERAKKTQLNIIRHRFLAGEEVSLTPQQKALGITAEDVEKEKQKVVDKRMAVKARVDKLTSRADELRAERVDGISATRKKMQKSIDRSAELTYTARQLLNKEITTKDLQDKTKFDFSAQEIERIKLRKRALRDRRGRQTVERQQAEATKMARIEILAKKFARGETIDEPDRDFIDSLTREEKDIGNFLYRQSFQRGGKVTSLRDIDRLLDKHIKTRPLQIGDKPQLGVFDEDAGMGTYAGVPLVTKESLAQTAAQADNVIRSVEAQTGVPHGTIAEDFAKETAKNLEKIKELSKAREKAELDKLLKKSAEKRLKDRANIEYKTIIEQNKTGLDIGYGEGQVAPETVNRVKAMSKSSTGFFRAGSKEVEIAEKLFKSGTISRKQYNNVKADLASEQKSMDYANVQARDAEQLGVVPGFFQALPMAYGIGTRAANEALNLRGIGLDVGLGDAANFAITGAIGGAAFGAAAKGLKVAAGTKVGQFGLKGVSALGERVGAQAFGREVAQVGRAAIQTRPVQAVIKGTQATIGTVTKGAQATGRAIGRAADVPFDLARAANVKTRRALLRRRQFRSRLPESPTGPLYSRLPNRQVGVVRTKPQYTGPPTILKPPVKPEPKFDLSQTQQAVKDFIQKGKRPPVRSGISPKLVDKLDVIGTQRLSDAGITNADEAIAYINNTLEKAGFRFRAKDIGITRDNVFLSRQAVDTISRPKPGIITRGAYEVRGGAQKLAVDPDAPVYTLLHEFGHAVEQNVSGLNKLSGKLFSDVSSQFKSQFGDYLTSPREIFANVFAKERMGLLGKEFDLTSILKGLGLQSGSYISGAGTGDTVPAMLEPGEFVLNRNAVRAVGADNLDNINRKYARFQSGGTVGRRHMQEGGVAQNAGMIQISPESLSVLNNAVQVFGTNVEKFSEQINNLNGMSIQMQGTHTVEVIINGAQVMQNLKPEIAQLVETETKKALNNFIKTRLPDLPPVD